MRVDRLAAWGLALGASGCLQARYLTQAIGGQDDIGHRSRPIAEAMADPDVPWTTRAMLGRIERVKRFGERQGLTRTDNYREFADLERPAVVWVLTASAPLRFEAVTWWFPVVGTVPYLGWFDRAEADRLARDLGQQGLDADVRPARAYSTLGWFRDPVLSTMLRDGPEELVEVVLHESVHATHYVPSQTIFNESLANFVARALTEQFLVAEEKRDPWARHDRQEATLEEARRARRLAEARAELVALYASARPEEAKRAEKRRLLDELQRELGLSRRPNNATLLQSEAYDSGARGFAALFAACGRSWPRFLAAARTIDSGSFARADERNIDDVVGARARTGC